MSSEYRYSWITSDITVLWEGAELIGHQGPFCLGGVFNLDADSLKEVKGRLHELPSTFCILVFPQITRLRRCIPALVAFAGHGPGVSLGAAGERRLTRHLSTTLGHGADSGNPTLPSFLSSPTRTLCSALFSSV